MKTTAASREPRRPAGFSPFARQITRIASRAQATAIKRERLQIRQRKHLHANAGYGIAKNLRVIDGHGDIAHVVNRKREAEATRSQPQRKARRWVVEVCHSWLNRFRKVLVRYQNLGQSFVALNHLATPTIGCPRVSLAVNVRAQLCDMTTRPASNSNMRDGYGPETHWNEHESGHRSIVALMLNSASSQTRHQDLDLYNAAALVDAFVGDQAIVVAAALSARSAFARVADEVAPWLAAGGRLINADAGTSGRLGVLDSVELLPALGWTRQQAPALTAGSPATLLEAIEDAKDGAVDSRNDIQALALNRNDLLLALSASGATPYAMGAAKAAREAGALTMGLPNNPVHIDDYFYSHPETGTAFPDDEPFDAAHARGNDCGDRDAWRRANIDALVTSLAHAVHAARPMALFGVSPFGIGRTLDRPAGIKGFDPWAGGCTPMRRDGGAAGMSTR